jgi:hypothetical protein
LVSTVAEQDKFKDRRDFLSQAAGVRNMFRDAKLKLKEEGHMSESTLTEHGERVLAAKQEIRKVGHLGSKDNMDDFWAGMMTAEPGTHQTHYLAAYVHDVHKAVELLYARNLEILHLLRQGRDGSSSETGGSSSKPAVCNDRSLKGTAIAKEIRNVIEPMILEQPFSLRGTGKHILATISSSRLLWPQCSYEEKVCTFLR